MPKRYLLIMTSSPIKNIGVLTSGGDAPGMNAAIRSVVRTAITNKKRVLGIQQGFRGVLEGLFSPLELRSVANIIQRGGTMLKSGRYPEFLNEKVRADAAKAFRANYLDALIVIGGDGSFRGAHQLWEEHKIPVVGIPGTIDNDIIGTDSTIGFDTAVNTALDAIDKIRDTAASHDRLFIVEVMGHSSGFIATAVGLAGGAEEVFVPEIPYKMEEVIDHIQRGVSRGKKSSILVAAEGQKPGRAYDLAEALRKNANLEARVCVLGHIQRGGSPTASDRILASRLGAAAVRELLKGQTDVMVGTKATEIMVSPLADVMDKKRPLDTNMLGLIQTLAN